MSEDLQTGAAEAAPQALAVTENASAQRAPWEITNDQSRPREQLYARDQVVPSKTNPRKHFDQAALEELAESIRKHGILMPILCRPLPGDIEGRLEIIAGERRFRAAGIADLVEIPVRIIQASDLEVLELQIIENLQRKDLHELEEAESYEALLSAHKGESDYGVDQIAAKLGKSRGYIYARLKLCALNAKARKAFYDGKLNASTALLIARIPVEKLQAEALKDITEGYRGVMAYREAADHIQRNYMLRLDQAKFKITDASLVAAAGSCAECPKRTGANPDLFSDVGRADVCTDPECFNGKRAAHSERLRLAAEESGQKVITGKEAKKIMPYQHADLEGYVRPEDLCWKVEGGKTYGKLLGKDAPEPVLIESPHTGEMVKAWPEAHVVEKLKDKGLVVSRAKSESNDRMRKEEAKVKGMRAHRRAVLARIHTSAKERMGAGQTLSPDDLLLIVTHALNRMANDHEGPVKEIWGFGREQTSERTAQLASLSPNDLALLLLSITLAPDAHVGVYWNQGEPKDLWATAQRYGVDQAVVKKELAAAEREKAAAKAGKKAPVKKASPASAQKSKAKDAKKAAPAKKGAVMYRNTLTGETWSGRGKAPRWITVAEEGGSMREDFLVSAPEAANAKVELNADAGTADQAEAAQEAA
jgi:ParB/RepB/Spo0J family partition protein